MWKAEVRARVSATLNRAVAAVCVLFVLAMLGVSFIGFAYMVVTGDALSWTYSLARLFIPWVGLLSVTVAFVRGEHIAMTALLGRAPPALARALHWANTAIVALFAGLMIWYGALFFVNSTDIYMVSDQIQIHARWVVASVPLTGAVLLVHILCGVDLLTLSDPMKEAEHFARGEPEDARP